MNYLSVSFLLFCLGAAAIYYVLPKSLRVWVLLGASVVFYLSYGIAPVGYLLFTALTTFLWTWNSPKLSLGGGRFGLILLCIVNIVPWFVTKGYPGELFGYSQAGLIAPLGISYYLVKALSYVFDVQYKKIQPEKNFGTYLLYLTYFPTVVQGPILRYDQMTERLSAAGKFDADQWASAITVILFGLLKKVVIADRLAILANHCFENYQTITGVYLYLGALAYSIQLYADFSGCVDICKGVSRLFGIELPDNFNAPYFARSIKEFWGRWHITFSGWLKEYVYISLGGNRKGKLRKNLNLVITFLVSGIWHGTGLNFMVWGLLHAAYQIVGDCTYGLRRKLRSQIGMEADSVSEKIIQRIITFNLVLFAWIFFRAPSLEIAWAYVINMFTDVNVMQLFAPGVFNLGLSRMELMLVAVHCAALFVFDYLQNRKIDMVENVCSMHFIVRTCLYMLLIYDIMLFGVYGAGYSAAGFLYGGF